MRLRYLDERDVKERGVGVHELEQEGLEDEVVLVVRVGAVVLPLVQRHRKLAGRERLRLRLVLPLVERDRAIARSRGLAVEKGVHGFTVYG